MKFLFYSSVLTLWIWTPSLLYKCIILYWIMATVLSGPFSTEFSLRKLNWFTMTQDEKRGNLVFASGEQTRENNRLLETFAAYLKKVFNFLSLLSMKNHDCTGSKFTTKSAAECFEFQVMEVLRTASAKRVLLNNQSERNVVFPALLHVWQLRHFSRFPIIFVLRFLTILQIWPMRRFQTHTNSDTIFHVLTKIVVGNLSCACKVGVRNLSRAFNVGVCSLSRTYIGRVMGLWKLK